MYPMLKRLNEEWATLLTSTTAQVARWSDDVAALPADASLGDVLDWIAREPDPALHFLIGEAQRGDSLAARTVLQTMLGKLVLVSVRSARPWLGQETAFTDLATQMWVTVASYPLAARPTKIAANLWMDCAKQTRRQWKVSHPEPGPNLTYSPDDATWLLDDTIAAQPADTRWAETRAADVIRAARQLDLIAPDTAELLMTVYGPQGLSGELTARIWGISPAAVRTRCSRAVRALARSADLLAAA